MVRKWMSQVKMGCFFDSGMTAKDQEWIRQHVKCCAHATDSNQQNMMEKQLTKVKKEKNFCVYGCRVIASTERLISLMWVQEKQRCLFESLAMRKMPLLLWAMNDSTDSGPLTSIQGQSDVDAIAAKDFSCTDLEGAVCLPQQISKVGEIGISGKKNTYQNKTEDYVRHWLILLFGGKLPGVSELNLH